LIPTVSVVICTRDRPRELERCLRALATLVHEADETLVVDNGTSGSATVESIAEAHGARAVREPRPGLSRARNAGAARATKDIVVFIDDDALPQPGWLSHLLAPFADEQVMATSGRIVPERIESESERLFAAYGGFDLGPDGRVVDRSTDHWFEICNFGGIGLGGNLAIRRSAYEGWPGFHEWLGLGTPIPGNEEHYAFFGLVRAGHRVAYAPGAVVTHPYPRTMEALRAAVVRSCVGFAGYVTFLLAEEPRYRRVVLRYLVDAARGKPRTWRTSPTRASARVISRRGTLLAFLRGTTAYLTVRRSHQVARR
jgi:O-antigen biosynthesis protein